VTETLHCQADEGVTLCSSLYVCAITVQLQFCPQCVDIPVLAVTRTLCVILHSCADICCNELGCRRSDEILRGFYVHGTWV